MNPAADSHRPPSALAEDAPAWFPGPWVGGASLILGPLLLLSGVLLRIRFDFFFPQQLAAYQQHPTLMFAAYSAFAAGTVVLWPAVATLARLIARSNPTLAVWGGTLAMLGLFARTFHAGVDHLAFQIVAVRDIESATRIVGDSYGAYYLLNALNPTILVGWVVLAIGAYRSRTLGGARSVALGLMSALMLGVLKGSDWISVLATAGLCVALVPLGVQLLRAESAPSARTVVANSLLVLAATILLFVVGQLG
jgi:hypothetical protein